MANLGKIVYLTESQLTTLIHDGSITVGEQTVTYSENDIYMTPSQPNIPSGGTTGQVLKKKSGTDYDTEWGNASSGGGTWGSITGTLSNQTDLQTALDAKANASEIGIVVTGNQTAQGADEGQYIILRDSTISGCDDGLYKAAQAIPANTAIDSTYLTAVSGGIAGAIKQLTAKSKTETITFDANGFAQTSLSRSNTILFLACDTNDWYVLSVFGNNVYSVWAVFQTGLKNQTHTVVLYYFDV